MKKFNNLIVLGPLLYAIHHFEEHIIFNFIEWKLKYFNHSAAALSTEAILSILVCVLVVFALLHLVKDNRASAYVILYVLFTIEVINAFFHIFFSFYFYDFSPGAITAVLLYLPINFLIIRSAFQEEFLRSYLELCLLFVAGITTFALFELIGPQVIAYTVLLTPIYYIMMNKVESVKN